MRMTKACATYESLEGIREQRTGGQKPTFLCRTSEKMATDLRTGPIETRDGRKAFAPEVGQTEYEIPVEWMNRMDEVVEPKVSTTLAECANLPLTPSYVPYMPYMVECKELMGNFRAANLGVTHGVMLQRMKKAAFRLAKETTRSEAT